MPPSSGYFFADFIGSARAASTLFAAYFAGSQTADEEYQELGRQLIVVSIGLEWLDEEGRNAESWIFDRSDPQGSIDAVVLSIGDFRKTVTDLDLLLRRVSSANFGVGLVWQKLNSDSDLAEVGRLRDLMQFHGLQIQKILRRKINIPEALTPINAKQPVESPIYYELDSYPAADAPVQIQSGSLAGSNYHENDLSNASSTTHMSSPQNDLPHSPPLSPIPNHAQLSPYAMINFLPNLKGLRIESPAYSHRSTPASTTDVTPEVPPVPPKERALSQTDVAHTIMLTKVSSQTHDSAIIAEIVIAATRIERSKEQWDEIAYSWSQRAQQAFENTFNGVTPVSPKVYLTMLKAIWLVQKAINKNQYQYAAQLFIDMLKDLTDRMSSIMDNGCRPSTEAIFADGDFDIWGPSRSNTLDFNETTPTNQFRSSNITNTTSPPSAWKNGSPIRRLTDSGEKVRAADIHEISGNRLVSNAQSANAGVSGLSLDTSSTSPSSSTNGVSTQSPKTLTRKPVSVRRERRSSTSQSNSYTTAQETEAWINPPPRSQDSSTGLSGGVPTAPRVGSPTTLYGFVPGQRTSRTESVAMDPIPSKYATPRSIEPDAIVPAQFSARRPSARSGPTQNVTGQHLHPSMSMYPPPAPRRASTASSTNQAYELQSPTETYSRRTSYPEPAPGHLNRASTYSHDSSGFLSASDQGLTNSSLSSATRQSMLTDEAIRPGEEKLQHLKCQSAHGVNDEYYPSELQVFRNTTNGDFRFVTTIQDPRIGPTTQIQRFRARETEIVPEYGYDPQLRPVLYLRELPDPTAKNTMPGSIHSSILNVPASPVFKFDSTQDLLDLQGSLTGETVYMDVQQVRCVRLRGPDKVTRRVDNIRIQLWHDDSKLPPDVLNDNASFVTSGTALSRANPEIMTLRWSRLVIYLGRSNDFITAFITDDVLLKQEGDTLIFKGRKSNTDKFTLSRGSVRAKPIGGGPKKGGIRLDRKGIEPKDLDSYINYKVFEVDFEDTESLIRFQKTWNDMLQHRRKAREKIAAIIAEVERKYPIPSVSM